MTSALYDDQPPVVDKIADTRYSMQENFQKSRSTIKAIQTDQVYKTSDGNKSRFVCERHIH